MNILVTGASGFLGRHVVAELVARGHTVAGMVRPASEPGTIEGVRWVKADLRAERDLGAALAGMEVVVHLAAAVTGDEEGQFASTAVGTERLLAAMVEARVEKLVLASSFSVYDYRQIARNGVMDEESPVEIGRALYERDGYAVAKVWQERLCRRWAEGDAERKLAVLRPGFIWGRDHWDLAGIGQRVGGWQLVFGARRELPITHVENCAMAFALAAEKPMGWGKTFNVVDEHGVSAWE
ncbi:MAG: NAD(P)-dependent oxidoreductase, partial [Phycisphaeraceae bacterium]|nr:NAD(P)-dependent oxidoreductase [Phycisphaeraceae bacterium]